MENKTGAAGVQNMRDMQQFLTVRQVAECLQVSRSTIYELIKDGELKAVPIRGKAFRLRRDEVCEYFGV